MLARREGGRAVSVTTVYGINRTRYLGSDRSFIAASVLVSEADAVTYGSEKEAASQSLPEVDELLTEEELRATGEGRAMLAAFKRGDHSLLEAETKAQLNTYLRESLDSSS
jgi:hypothetical protein